MSRKILVTGGFGRVGSALIPMLLEAGYAVRVFTRHDHPEISFSCSVETIIGDLANYSDVLQAVEGTDLVCHLAALFPPLFFDESKIIETNVLGTFNILQAMKNIGKPKRIIFASTDAVYATGTSFDAYKGLLTEDMPLNPINVYGITKVVNEVTIKKYARLFDIAYVILRFFWSMRSEEMVSLMFEARNYMDNIVDEDKDGLMPDTIIDIRCEDGTEFSDHITDFRDIASGVFLAIKNKQVNNETINIAASELVNYSIMSKKIAEALGRPFRKVRVKGLKNYSADISKAQKLLGYDPKYSMNEMVKEAIEIK